MRISVIVPAYNEERQLPASLCSIRAAMTVFDRLDWSSELIVCDNNSTDGTSDIARAAGATVVFEPVNQIARARNAGAARATGDWLVFVDADSHPMPELFDDLAHVVQEGRCLGGGSAITFDSQRLFLLWFSRGWNAVSRLIKLAAGAFIFCEAATFREIGGFNQKLYASEEVDLFRRLKRAARRKGRTVVFLHRHPVRTSDRKLRLYTARELLTFFLRAFAHGGRTLRNRDECFPWYDGRREVLTEDQ